MPTAIEDCALQRVEGGQEQGCDQDVWQVLDELGCTAIGIYDLHAIVAETNKSQTNCVETRGVMRLTDLNHVHFT